MNNLNCPNCGDPLTPQFLAAKMVTCTSCETTLFLDSGHVQNAGSNGDMHDAPLLFQTGQTVHAGPESYDLIGHARFSYGAGWWDEFFAVTSEGEEVWISVDEGEVIVQRPLPTDAAPKIAVPPSLGDYVTIQNENYRVTEKNTATCIAFRGSFPEVLKIGTTYTYVNCQGDDGLLISGEFSTGVPDWYTGIWLDQYNLKIEAVS